MKLSDWWPQATAEQRNDLVAQRVMGWEKYQSAYGHQGWGISFPGKNMGVVTGRYATPDHPEQPYWNPQGDMRAAWEVHRQICDLYPANVREYFRTMEAQATAKAGQRVFWPDVLVWLREEMPAAICLAALAAVGCGEVEAE